MLNVKIQYTGSFESIHYLLRGKIENLTADLKFFVKKNYITEIAFYADTIKKLLT